MIDRASVRISGGKRLLLGLPRRLDSTLAASRQSACTHPLHAIDLMEPGAAPQAGQTPAGSSTQGCHLYIAVGARLRSHKFSPIEMSLQAADKPRRKRHHCRPQIRRGGVKGRSRRQPVRAAQPLRPLRLISTLHMPCDQPRCDQSVIEAVMARDARPFEGDPGASRLFGGRCRATCPRWRLGAYSACRAFTIASTADSRLLSTMVPG